MLAFGLPIFVGCSSDRVPTYPVRGTVRFDDGAPVRTGHVEFESVDHETTASGRIEDDGSFVLGTYATDDGAAAGEQRVLVLQIIINDGTVTHEKDHGDPVDPRFNRFETSGLAATVEPIELNQIELVVERQK